MRGFSLWAVAASAVTVGQAVYSAVSTNNLEVAPSSVAYLVVHLVTAGVVWKSAGLLPRPGAPPELHEPELMNGMRALAVSFVQIGSMHGFMSAVTMMDAAITWPPLIRVFSTFVIGVCFMRVVALGYLLDNYSPQQQAELQIGSVVGDKLGDRFPWLDRAAIVAVGGSLAIATAQAYQPRLAQADDASLPNEYNFHADAEKTFSGLMDSVRGAGSATALLGAAGFMAFAAELATHKSPLLWYGSLMGGIEAAAMAGLLFYSAGCFANILTTDTRDICLLLEGVSSDRGLTPLFQRLRAVQTGAIVGALILIPVVLPLVIRLKEAAASSSG